MSAADEYTHAYEEGYEKGHEDGYEKGHEDGYEKGHEDGFKVAYERPPIADLGLAMYWYIGKVEEACGDETAHAVEALLIEAINNARHIAEGTSSAH